MAYVKNLFDSNFIQYASYVIRDRAIPEITDGLKPVQRRIIHTLIKTDDGRFTKVANVCGKVMAYHPHGDASIYTALVNLANKELFIDKQGNFGNMFTGDGASAPRYIECRLKPITKEILNTNPKITPYVDTYDSRDVEPVTFSAKKRLIRAKKRDKLPLMQILRRFYSQRNLLKEYKKFSLPITILKN